MLNNVKITGIIPARYNSSRFPGKPLANINGKSMILRVYEQSLKAATLNEVIVATDDERIFSEITSKGGKALMTSGSHRNGTERCQEVALNHPSDYYINIQGDEPYISPEAINSLGAILTGEVELGTLVKKIEVHEQLDDPTTMKVLVNKNFEAIYFSRQCVPYLRDYPKKLWLEHFNYYKHIGIYAYRSDTLCQIVKLEPSKLEVAESLEQLRWIENGYKIKLAETAHESISIDTPEDLTRISERKHA